jgi:hypothetical protein
MQSMQVDAVDAGRCRSMQVDAYAYQIEDHAVADFFLGL